MALAEALLELQELTERLRRDCPWDREQTARTIVPHTVEEAYEVADAALADDDGKLLDELGDLLFQVYFLALLLEVGDLLFACVNVARRLSVDPELELRRATQRFVARVEKAERLAEAEGARFVELPLQEQDRYFDRAKERE